MGEKEVFWGNLKMTILHWVVPDKFSRKRILWSSLPLRDVVDKTGKPKKIAGAHLFIAQMGACFSGRLWGEGRCKCFRYVVFLIVWKGAASCAKKDQVQGSSCCLFLIIGNVYRAHFDIVHLYCVVIGQFFHCMFSCKNQKNGKIKRGFELRMCWQQ